MSVFKKSEQCIGLELISNRKRYKHDCMEYKMFLEQMNKYVSIQDDEEYFNFFIELLKKELRYSSLLEINRGGIKNRFIYPFHKMNSLFLNYKMGEEKIEINLNDNNLLSNPWNHSRYRNILYRLKSNAFKYSSHNHMAIYYDGLNITCAYNGFHSLGVGAYLGKGNIKAEYYNVEKIFDFVDANEDLSFTYNKKNVLNNISEYASHTSKQFEKALNKRFYGTDYRLMLIYELHKRKFQR